MEFYGFEILPCFHRRSGISAPAKVPTNSRRLVQRTNWVREPASVRYRMLYSSKTANLAVPGQRRRTDRHEPAGTRGTATAVALSRPTIERLRSSNVGDRSSASGQSRSGSDTTRAARRSFLVPYVNTLFVQFIIFVFLVSHIFYHEVPSMERLPMLHSIV